MRAIVSHVIRNCDASVTDQPPKVSAILNPLPRDHASWHRFSK